VLLIDSLDKCVFLCVIIHSNKAINVDPLKFSDSVYIIDKSHNTFTIFPV
jgi:hypothetical protein